MYKVRNVATGRFVKDRATGKYKSFNYSEHARQWAEWETHNSSVLAEFANNGMVAESFEVVDS